MSIRRADLVLSRRALLSLATLGSASMALGCRADGPAPSAAPRAAAGRPVDRLVPAQPTQDGAGVSLSRSVGSRALPLLDPFLLLDEIRTDAPDEYLRGFPKHPHRGFETVTYMVHGAMEHQDSVGNRGRLVSGAAQWMTAGRGIVHSEMPKQEKGLLWGFQLWVNLPARSKMMAPRYQDIPPEQIPEVSLAGVRTRVMAGTAAGATGPVSNIDVAPTFLDLAPAAGQAVEYALPAHQTSFVYVLDGSLAVGPEGAVVPRGHLAVLGAGDAVRLVGGADGGRCLLLAGDPIGEPVARRGPFVMNTQAELEQAFADYRSGVLGG